MTLERGKGWSGRAMVAASRSTATLALIALSSIAAPASSASTRDLEQSCRQSNECRSGACDVGWGTSQTGTCVPAPGTGRTGEYCTNHKYCKSVSCSGHNRPPRHRGECIGTRTVELASRCIGPSDCRSGTCDTGSGTSQTGLCVPAPGTGTVGTFCTNNKYCKSGVCTGHTSRDKQGFCAPATVSGRCPDSSSCPPGKCGTPDSLVFAKLNTGTAPLRGVVDLHTHPMSHLGFGGKVLHGAPGIGVLMPSGSIDCGPAKRAGSAREALGSCYPTHGGHDVLRNACGNHVRNEIVRKYESANHANTPHDIDHPDGFETFNRWPRHDDILHQSMWVDWVKRAYDGGLRVMVALAVNSVTLATGFDGTPPYDDKTSGDTQLAELVRWVNGTPFMGLAKSSAELKRIVGQDKLAVVLGVELDDMGSFVLNRGKRKNREPTPAEVRAEVRRLHRAGVRYVFPIHVIDNFFGGTAVYEHEFARANRYHWGEWWDLACATPSDGITHQVEAGADLAIAAKLGEAGGTQPIPTCPHGHKNARGLTALGRVALDQMMQLGMLIDIDHMSQRTVAEVFAHTRARSYPLLSGHSGLRGVTGNAENTRTASEYREIVRRGGIAALGFSDTNAAAWSSDVAKTLDTLGDTLALAIGTDANGFAPLPPKRACREKPCVSYSAQFPKACFNGREWDYNLEGVAHYGLLPDFLRDVEVHGDRRIVERLFNGAEAFAKAWEAAERRGR
jgi:hypothetical protein